VSSRVLEVREKILLRRFLNPPAEGEGLELLAEISGGMVMRLFENKLNALQTAL
jgi:hypothetical protein